MSAPLSTEQLADIREVLTGLPTAPPADVREAGVTLLAEVARLRAALSEATGHIAGQDAEIGGWSARVAELEAQAAKVAEFVAERAEYITAIRNCHPDNGHDYDRWQGHAAARRQLAEKLGLPVAWPAEGGVL